MRLTMQELEDLPTLEELPPDPGARAQEISDCCDVMADAAAALRRLGDNELASRVLARSLWHAENTK